MEETYQDPPSTKQLAIKWGSILGVISIAFGLFNFTMGITEGPLQWLGMIPTIIIIFLAHKEYKDSGDGFMTYGKGLGIGTLVSLVSGIISSVFSYVYLSFIDASYLDLVRERQIEQLEEQGMSDAQIEQALSFSEFFTSPMGLLIMGIIGAVIVGFIISLIISAITKKNDPSMEI